MLLLLLLFLLVIYKYYYYHYHYYNLSWVLLQPRWLSLAMDLVVNRLCCVLRHFAFCSGLRFLLFSVSLSLLRYILFEKECFWFVLFFKLVYRKFVTKYVKAFSSFFLVILLFIFACYYSTHIKVFTLFSCQSPVDL